MTQPGIWDRWWPVTYDHGLLQADVTRAAESWRAAYAASGSAAEMTVLHESLQDCLARLEPLSPAPTTDLFLATNFGWTVFLRNGFRGSDPFLPMSRLARQLGVTGMRVCCAPDGARHRSVIWEVYESPERGGGALGYRRSIAAAQDGARWVFETSGTAFAFEETDNYEKRLKRDRFTSDMLARYLGHFGIPVLGDEVFGPGVLVRGVLLSRPDHDHLPLKSLSEVVADHGCN